MYVILIDASYSQRLSAYGGYQGYKPRLGVLQRLRLHRPYLTTQKQQQGIPISLDMATLEYESFPLDPSVPVDFFSDPMSLDDGSNHST